MIQNPQNKGNIASTHPFIALPKNINNNDVKQIPTV
jgi:hypothetical protein